MRIARVVVDIPTRQLDAAFDYAIPDEISDIEIGSCVSVEFGHRPAVGYVVGLAERSDQPSLRPLVSADGKRWFPEYATQLAPWIAAEYCAPLSEALKLFLPTGAAPRVVRDAAGAWVARGSSVGPVDDRWASLASAAEPRTLRANARMQHAVMDALAEGPVRVAELSATLGSCDGALRKLAELGFVTLENRRRIRALDLPASAATSDVRLSEGQALALAAIEGSLQSRDAEVIVLEGVTGSGKTEVYLRAISEAISAGGCACVLVPEISLTPQTVGRFRSRFGDEVAVLHSRLSLGERYDQWDRVREGEARVVVGARSALFAPFRDLRIIVIDEEHESSYKQGSSPRYHARDVAAQLARLTGATLVLGSATPSMEAQRRCESGDWTRILLPERVTGWGLPDIEVIDMGAEFKSGNRSMFSKRLAEELRNVAYSREKAIVLLNRRGFASFLLCRECGFVPTCENCSTSLTYHDGGRLLCHHCASDRIAPSACPGCGSPYLRQFGAGTQRVETELAQLLPELPCVRMDADTTKGKGGHQRALAQFEALDSGILLGTQMIAKGLDFPEVTLVGVVNADTTLHIPDFRAGERTYQMLEQVSGRAGRGSKPGRVIVQTYWPDHPAIRAVASHDKDQFYAQEKVTRAELGYPPYSRLANITVAGEDAAAVAQAAAQLASTLGDMPKGWQVLGPSPSPIARLKGMWRWHIVLKAPEGADLPALLSAQLARRKPIDGVSVVLDVDPVDML